MVKANESASESETALSTERRFSDEQLSALQSPEDVQALFLAEGIDVYTADEELGTGFAVVDNKERFIGVPLFLLEWHFNQGDMGEFVSIVAMTGSGEKVIINDGSTGICDQLRHYTAKTHRTQALAVRKGLRVSRYTYTEVDPKTGEETQRPAETFYLDTSR